MTPLFIVGAPRSGTTVTRTLMQGFAPVYLPPDEFQVLPRFVADVESGASPETLARFLEGTVFAGHMRRRGIWPDRTTLLEALTTGEASSSFQALVLAIAAKEGRSDIAYWGDKTPETVFHLALLNRIWPNARVLHVVRDPRSTVLSMSRAWGRSLSRGAVIWRDTQRAASQFESYHPELYLRLHFEALTTDPSTEMDRVGAWLGLHFDHAMLDKVSSEERWGKASGRVGVQKRPEEWDGALSAAQICQIEAISFAEMTAAGYSPRYAESVVEPGALSLKMARLGDAARVVRAYAHERGWRAALSYKINQWRIRS